MNIYEKICKVNFLLSEANYNIHSFNPTKAIKLFLESATISAEIAFNTEGKIRSFFLNLSTFALSGAKADKHKTESILSQFPAKLWIYSMIFDDCYDEFKTIKLAIKNLNDAIDLVFKYSSFTTSQTTKNRIKTIFHSIKENKELL